MLHDVKIKTTGARTKVFIDRKELCGVKSLSINYAVNCVPVLKIEMYTKEITIDADKADVTGAEEE